jgi:hypothetical protein
LGAMYAKATPSGLNSKTTINSTGRAFAVVAGCQQFSALNKGYLEIQLRLGERLVLDRIRLVEMVAVLGRQQIAIHQC